MKNYKVLDSKNLFYNLSQFDDKKVCAMVKSNAYGHGIKEIVNLLKDRVECFGVAHVEEGMEARKWTDKPILICSKIHELKKCKKYNLDVMVENEIDLKKCLKYGLENQLHLKLDCGMNRFGVKSSLQAKILNDLIEEKKLNLKSIYTHFPCTDDKKMTQKNYFNFQKLRSEISQNTHICFGGSNIIDYKFEFDTIRVGIGLYGYGHKQLRPVMKIVSFVSKIFYADSGEFVGYGKNYKVRKGGFFAVVPVGYGDGLKRNLSGHFVVKISERSYFAVGSICMDCFYVKVDENVNVGDEVVVMENADYFAKKLKTISYEILTGFSPFRGTVLKK